MQAQVYVASAHPLPLPAPLSLIRVILKDPSRRSPSVCIYNVQFTELWEFIVSCARIRWALSAAQWLDDVEPGELLMRRFARPLCLICSHALLVCFHCCSLLVGTGWVCTRRCLNVLLIECWVECKEPGNFCNWQFTWHSAYKSAFDNWPVVIYGVVWTELEKPSLYCSDLWQLMWNLLKFLISLL